MAQFEPFAESFEKANASLIFVAAEKRSGIFRPEKFFEKKLSAFPFLLDEDRAVTRAWGIYHRFGTDAFNIARPASFVVGSNGVVRWIYVGTGQLDRAPVETVLQQVIAAR